MNISSFCLSSCPPCSPSSSLHGIELTTPGSRRTALPINKEHVKIKRTRPGRNISCAAASSTSNRRRRENDINEILLEELESSKPITIIHGITGPFGQNPPEKTDTIKDNESLCSGHQASNSKSSGDSKNYRHNRRGTLEKINHAPFAMASANALFTIESTPIRDRIETFDKLNWKGKAYVLAILACGVVGTAYVGGKAYKAVKERVLGRGGEDAGGGDDGSPYNIIAKGFTTVQSNLGPWSFQDLTLGLAALSKVSEKGPPEPPGQPAKELAQNANFLARAQHWRAMAEAVYTFDPASFSLQSQLPESAIVAAEWLPCQETLRPAYVVCVDAPYGAIVLTVRGTSQVVDMLVNSGASAEIFLDGQGHGGFVHATNKLLIEVVPHIKEAFEEHSKAQNNLKLVVVGHSMGAAVGIMVGLELKKEFPNVECWGFSTPACVTLETARGCKEYVTSFVANHDIVPRFSIVAVEQLRNRIIEFDWEEAEKIAHGDEDWNNIKMAADNLKKVGEKQNEVSKPVEQAQEGVSAQVQNFHENMGSPFRNNSDKKESKKEKKEEGIPPPLFPPGRLLVLASDPPGCGKLPEDRDNVPKQRSSGAYPTFDEAKKVKWVLHEADQEDLSEIVVSPWCVSDHMLGNLGEGIGYLQRHCEPAFGGPPPM